MGDQKKTRPTIATDEPTAEEIELFFDVVMEIHREAEVRNSSLHKLGFLFSQIPKKKRSALNRPSGRDTDHSAPSTLTPSKNAIVPVIVPPRRAGGKRLYADLKQGCDDDDAERCPPQRSVKKPTRSSKNNSNIEPIPPILGWLENVVKESGGSQIRFVMKKKLSQCDLSANNNRLSIPERQIRQEFLTDEEKQILSTRDTEGGRRDKLGRPKSIDVKFVDPCMREHTLRLKRWEMVSSITFNLTGKWKEVVKSNNLQENQIFHIWCYRNNHSTLTFVLAPLTHQSTV